MSTPVPLERELDVQRQAMQGLRDRMPNDWVFEVSEDRRAAGRGIDAVMELGAPDSPSATVLIETKRSVVTRDLPEIIDRLGIAAKDLEVPEAVPMIVARYLPPPVRAWLEQRTIAYADATGNLFLRLTSPAVFVRDRGADSDPWRGPGRPRGTLKGKPAARVVRALTDFRPPVTVPALATRSGTSLGATYRVAEFLEQELLLERKQRGPIVAVKWRRVLERWSQDYQFQSNNTITSVLQPRGLQEFLKDLAQGGDLRYAVTGSLAAANWASYAQPRLAMVYVDDPAAFVEAMGLRRVDTGANVLLAAPTADFVFDRTVTIEGVTYTAPAQTAVDLLTGPGRSPAEGEALLDWMEANESEWRS